MDSARPVLIYALGGGWGHLTRGLALARQLVRRGQAATVLCNSPYSDRVDEPGVGLEAVPASWERAAVTQAVDGLLARPAWSALVVDTFPRGLGGELAAWLGRLTLPKVWVSRAMTPAYAERPEVRAAALAYDLILAPGEGPSLPLPHQLTTPWLIRDPDELLSREEARARLGVSPGDERPLRLVSGCGTASELAASRARARALAEQLAEQAHVRWVGPVDDPQAPRELSYWPLLELLPGVDELVGAGGYHSVHECRATGVPLRAAPQPRLYDDQQRRLAASPPPGTTPAPATNGAAEAADLLLALTVLEASPCR